jgi:RimJ/RimL family protein N-acetyltransferase
MLVTERLRLREWREADKPLLAEIHSDPEVMRFLGGVKTFDETSEVIDLIGGMFRAGKPGLWATERIEDEKLIGWIGLHQLVRRFHETDLLWRIPSVAPHVVS